MKLTLRVATIYFILQGNGETLYLILMTAWVFTKCIICFDLAELSSETRRTAHYDQHPAASLDCMKI